MSKSDDYYEECTEHKRIKSEIVSLYLKPWVNIVGPHADRIYYLDLFSGRGKFKDKNETPATPLLVFDVIQETAIKSPWILEKLQVCFYEGRKSYFEILEKSLKNHSIYKKLANKPIIEKKIIDSNFISKIISETRGPLFTFIDPFGFKGYSLGVIDEVTKAWGRDCLFYLSIAGLVRNLRISVQKKNLIGFFGEENYQRLHQKVIRQTKSGQLSNIIFDEIVSIIRQKRNYFMAPFCVEFDDKKRPSHFLVFLSKHERGFVIMRDMMIKRGIIGRNGLPILVFSPKSDDKKDQFELDLQFESLTLIKYSNRMRKDFGGRRVSFSRISSECVNRGYLLRDSHIRIVLTNLEKNKKVMIERLDQKGNRRSGGKISKYDYITFPW